MSTLSNHWHAQHPFLMDNALLSISPASFGQLVKMLTTLESHGSNIWIIFCILIYCPATGIQNGNEPAGRLLNVDNCRKSQNNQLTIICTTRGERRFISIQCQKDCVDCKWVILLHGSNIPCCSGSLSHYRP